MNSKIYILSDTIQSGKTTALWQLCKLQKNACGILTPDIDALRCLIDIETGNRIPFQKNRITHVNDIVIGKYIFDGTTFDKAKSILQTLHQSSATFFIIDEIGKLELQNIGLEPALSFFIHQIKLMKNKTIIFVIRDYLLQDCILKYNLHEAIILNVSTFKTTFQ